MKITPIEIRQKEFQKSFRGIDKDEVAAFLQSLSQEWERVLDETKELRMRLESSERELAKLREVENSLFKTLKTAEDTGASLIEQTKKETELQLRASKMQSEQIVNEAKANAKSILDNADHKARMTINEMMEKIKSLEVNYNQLFDQREKLINQLKNFIRDNGEKIEKLTRQIPEKESAKVLKNAFDLFNSNLTPKEAVNPPAEIKREKQEVETKVNEPENKDVLEVSKTGQPEKSFFDEIE
jgi:cell division initiation protein